ncbi:MAG TPA: PA14 domain-containing protein, partial [Patescibacteria group bacterium]|nr:PA14 domain-containing protein [Patescibacteria group bacterium]
MRKHNHTQSAVLFGWTKRAMHIMILLVLIVSTFIPAMSAYAAERPVAPITKDTHIKAPPKDAMKPMAANYAGPMPQSKVATPIAADAQPNNVLGKLTTKAVGNDPLTSPTAITPHELTNKRTATSDTSVNKDGSLSQRQYFTPHYYQKDNAWQSIDASLVADDNAGDATNALTKAFGAAESWVSSTTNFTIKANDWQSRFGPSDFDGGMVRIKKGNSQIGFSPINAKKVAPVVTADNKGNQTVHYYDLWPGVNVEYTVNGGEVKENIVLKDRTATSNVAFRLIGASATADKKGGYSLTGALNNEFGIAPINLMLNSFGFESNTKVYKQTYDNGVLTVSVDKTYLQNLPVKAFPAVIDPTVQSAFGTRTGGSYVSLDSNGYVCASNVCNLYAGTKYDTNGNFQVWRGALFSPYEQLRPQGTVLASAVLHLAQRTNAGFWTGSYDTHTFTVGRATCLNNIACVDGWYNSAAITTSGGIDATPIYQNALAQGDFGAWLMVGGEDGTDSSFKNFDPDNSYVTFAYMPPAPTIASPAPNQIFTDPQPSFTANPPTNPTGNYEYSFRVSSGPGGSGTVIASGNLDARQWTIPDGILQDGSTYYVQARVYEAGINAYSSWGTSVPFKIDMRTGKDKTQTFDTLGPVSADLATGNLTTSASSHTTAALGGSLGVSLDYNSPLHSRAGLVGQYWNNMTMTGTPLVTRIDQAIDFDWGIGSPSSGIIPNDSYSASWAGYFVAPAADTYYFGGSNDDNMNVTVNGQSAYTNAGCWPGSCFGTTAVTLTAGQVVPISVSYVENTGSAYAHLMVKHGTDSRVVPQAWLQTGIRPVQKTGLTGHYYTDDGTHTFGATSNTLFMQRNDSFMNFDWANGSPVPNGPSDNFMVRWSGFVTAPTTGSYQFGTHADDGTKVTINNTLVESNWQDTPGETWGSSINLTAGQAVPVTVDYYEHTGGAVMTFEVKINNVSQPVPSTWLSPNAQVLPSGWSLGIDPDGNLGYDYLKANQNDVVLTDSSGDTHTYAWTGSGYKPPVNEDGQLVRNANGSFTLQDVDGRTYIFNADGTLASVTTPTDDLHPAALKYTYGGTPSHIVQIADGVDPSRTATAYYSGDTNCGTTPSGYDTSAPANMLCALKTTDGRATYFYYSSGLLSRIAKPGNENLDYFYDTLGRITGIRDPLANDAIAAGVRANDATATTQITYDILGRVTNVTRPAATAGATPIQNTIEYLPGTLNYQNGNPTTGYFGASQEHVVGATEPNGFSRRVEYDNLFRTTKDSDIANLSTTTAWDAYKDLQMSSTSPTGLMSTTVYDDEDRPVSQYGSAPAAWYDTWHWILAAGQSLTPGQSLKSPDGRFQLTFQTDGNVVLSGPSGAIWYTGTGGQTATTFTMQTDGNLVLYNGTTALWNSMTGGGGPSSYFYVQNDGHLVVYNSTGYTWASNSGGWAPATTPGSYDTPLSAYTAQVAHNTTAYDQNMSGPAVAYYTYDPVTKTLTGTPKLHSTNLAGAVPGDVMHDYGTSGAIAGIPDNWGFTATAKLRLPSTGTYTFRLWSDNGARIYIDDQLVSDDWNDGVGHYHPNFSIANVAGQVHRFRMDFYHRTNDANIGLYVTPPGGSEIYQGITQYFSPDYSLATSTTTYDATLGNRTTTTNYGSMPEYGLAQSTSVDPTGLNLTTASTYEAPGATGSYLRQLTKTLPGGVVTNYTYYGATETRANPCVTGSSAISQAGMIKIKTDPDPDGSGSQTGRATETIYDASGNAVATRYNSENWTCVTYDTRNRVSQTHVQAFNGNSDRTISNNYAVSGNPLQTATYDENGWVITDVDLLGRTTAYTDTYGDWTGYGYDAVGNLIRQYGDMGEHGYTYDNLNRLTSEVFGGITYANVTYDTYSRIDHVDYPAAGQLRVTNAYDTFGRNSTVTYRLGNGTTTVSDTVNRTQSNQINTDTVTSGSASLASAYTYDAADRLTAATIGANTYSYGFGTANTSCNSLAGNNVSAGKDSNRTTQTVNGTTTTYCYNQADQLIGSSDAQYNTPTYDTRGNMTSLGTNSSPLALCYDASDRNSCLTQLNPSGTGPALYYARDATNRITYREKDTVTNW